MQGLGTHLRSNVVGYVALFFALTTGAYATGALSVPGPNTVGPEQIAPDAVRAPEIKRNAVGSTEVKNKGLKKKDVKGLAKKFKLINKHETLLLHSNGVIAQLGKLRRDLDSLTKRVADLEATGSPVTTLTNDLNDLQDQVDGLLDDLGVNTGDLTGFVDDLSALQGTVNTLKGTVDSTVDQLGLNSGDTTGLADDLTALQGTVNGVTGSGGSLATLDSRADSLCTQAESVNTAYRSLITTLDGSGSLGSLKTILGLGGTAFNAATISDYDNTACQG